MKSAEAAGEEGRFYRERGFGLRIGFGHRAAILTIDFMRAFTDPSLPLGSDLTKEIAAANALISRARLRGLPIIHTVVAYEDADLQDAGIWRLKQTGLETLRSGTQAVELDARLDYTPQDTVLLKKFASGFFGTDLAARLRTQGIDTVVLTGCTTSGCVRATAVDACQHGFRPMIVREAVGDRSPAAHAQSLLDLDMKYGDVLSLEEAISALS